MSGRLIGIAMVSICALGSQGCAAIGLSLFGAGASVGGSSGIDYTFNSTAYRTFPNSEDEVRAAALQTLRRMAIEVKETKKEDSGTEITASAGKDTVEIEIDHITPRTSKMRVAVKRAWIVRDRSTAGEIVAQTGHALEKRHQVAASGR
jgi:hypothetical protein